MNDSIRLWPAENMDFWRIEGNETVVSIRWSHDCFQDYKVLAYQFYECGHKTFEEVISSGHDNNKSDMWFLTGIFLIRQGIELGLKSLLCRCLLPVKKDIQNTFEKWSHNVLMLYEEYSNTRKENYLSSEENEWLVKYLTSLEEVDEKSDMFRFPFKDEFLEKYKDAFLDNVDVANNLLQAFAMVKKCIEKGANLDEDKFDNSLTPKFFVFSSHGFANCCLRQYLFDEGFYEKVTGYSKVIDFIYQNQQISKENKFYPIMFMFRNTIELCLKRLFYSRIDDGVPVHVFKARKKSHLIKKDLWKHVKPVIVRYANDSGNDTIVVDIVEKLIEKISELDSKGDMFRYPTSYSLEYRFDNKVIDLKNVYEYMKALTNFLEDCYSMLEAITEYQDEMKAEHSGEMGANMA